VKNADYALIFKALSDNTRLKIIEMLNEEELCACDILKSLNITQPTLSYHMKILCDSDIVSAIRDGAWMNYNLNKDKLAILTAFLCRFNFVSENKKSTLQRKK